MDSSGAGGADGGDEEPDEKDRPDIGGQGEAERSIDAEPGQRMPGASLTHEPHGASDKAAVQRSDGHG